MRTARRDPLPGKPIHDRSRWRAPFCAVLGLLACASPALGESLREEDAVARVLARPEVRALLDADVELARAAAADAGAWPDPELSYEREDLDGEITPGSREETFGVRQTFDLSARRFGRWRAARQQVAASELGREFRLQERAAAVRALFRETLAQQRRLEEVRRWAERLGRMADSMARRFEAGDVSAYDRGRIDRERASGAARLAIEEARLTALAARLAADLGQPDAPVPVLEGTLLDPTPLPARDGLRERIASRPDLRALEREVRAAAIARGAARRWWIPDPSVGAGVKRTAAGDAREEGWILEIGVPLPLFDRGKGERLRAGAELRARQARLRLATDAALARAGGLHAQAARLQEAARAFRAEAVEPAAPLVEAAEAAYDAGELGILELLDAYRSALDAHLQALEIEEDAARARIELDLALGDSPS